MKYYQALSMLCGWLAFGGMVGMSHADLSEYAAIMESDSHQNVEPFIMPEPASGTYGSSTTNTLRHDSDGSIRGNTTVCSSNGCNSYDSPMIGEEEFE